MGIILNLMVLKGTHKRYPSASLNQRGIETTESEGSASAGSGVNSPFPIKTLSLMTLMMPLGEQSFFWSALAAAIFVFFAASAGAGVVSLWFFRSCDRFGDRIFDHSLFV